MLVAYVGGAASEEDFEWMEWPTWSTRVRAPRRGEGRGTEKGDGEGGSCAGGVEESWWQLQFDNGVTIHVCVCVCVCVCLQIQIVTQRSETLLFLAINVISLARAGGRGRALLRSPCFSRSLSLLLSLARLLVRSIARVPSGAGRKIWHWTL